MEKIDLKNLKLDFVTINAKKIVTKKCPSCDNNKTLNDFNKLKSSSDGYQYTCRECQTQYRKNNKKFWENNSIPIKGNKKCSICDKIKSYSHFYVNKTNKDGYDYSCKICKIEIDKKYEKTEKGKEVRKRAKKKYRNSENGKKTIKNYNNSENGKKAYKKYKTSKKGKETNRNYRKNSLKYKETTKKYNASEKGKEVQLKSIKNYMSSKKGKDTIKKYKTNRYKNDIVFKLGSNIRNLIKNSFKLGNWSKLSKTAKILCCNYETFKMYIEEQFKLPKNLDENGNIWMTWNNHGKYTGNRYETWQFDHIIPMSSAKNQDEAIKLNHYTNFQPLCSYENQVLKRDKLDYI